MYVYILSFMHSYNIVSVMSLQSMLSPEEIYNNTNAQKDNNNATKINTKLSRGSIIADTELTKQDRKRVRRMKKRKHSKSVHELENAKRNANLASALTMGNSTDRNPNVIAADYEAMTKLMKQKAIKDKKTR